MPGPPPLPTKLKLLTGNRGKRPINDQEPSPENKIPRKPPFLRGKAATEWYRMSKLLFDLELLTEVDSTALAIYCQNWERWLDAEKAIKKEGLVVETPTGRTIANPYVLIGNKAVENMRKFLSEFGMTPASRTRIRIPTKKKRALGFEDI